MIALAVAAFVVLFVLWSRIRGEETVSMPAGESSTGGPEAIEALVVSGRKIEAIKLLRQEAGLGLKEAKDEIDEPSRRLQRN